MTLHASNGKFFGSVLGYAALHALFGREIEPFVPKGADVHGPSATIIAAIRDGQWFDAPASSGEELRERLRALLERPERTRGRDTMWGLLDEEDAFGHCPAKRLSRVMMTVYAQAIADDAFLERIRDTSPPSSKTVYEPRAAPGPGQVRSGPLARFSVYEPRI